MFLIPLWVYFSATHTVSFAGWAAVTETPLNGNSWGELCSPWLEPGWEGGGGMGLFWMWEGWPPGDTLCGHCGLSPFYPMPYCLEGMHLAESTKKHSHWGKPSISVLLTLFLRKKTEETFFY